MASLFIGVPELVLDPKEAKELSDAIAAVAKFYPTTFDPKKVAICNLAVVAGGIYSTRIMAYRLRVKSERSDPAAKVITMEKTKPAKEVNGFPAPKQATGQMPPVPSEIWNEPGAEISSL